jgi:hypothetical protein
MPKIILSYRRSDSDAISGRIRDRLVRDYGEHSVFMDIDSIPFGTDFRQHIQNAILQNDLLLAVVGPHWLGLNDNGPARIQEELDFVRIEIETAMTAEIPVIPLLVNGATMPRPEDLPASVKDFAFHNAATIDSGRDFHQHMDRLVRSINRSLAAGPRNSWRRFQAVSARSKLMLVIASIAVLIAVGLAAAWRERLFGGGMTMANSSASAPTGASAPPPVSAPRNGETVVDFGSIAAVADSSKPVAARPYLHQYGISVADLDPTNSEIVLVNNRGLYGGGAVVPTVSQNFLTQISTENQRASFTLQLDEPVDEIRFVRPQLFRDTKSGVTHPAWTATALAANGQQLSSVSEGLLRSLDEMPGDTSARTYTLRTPNFDRIAAVRFESDPRLNGRPFAAFSTLLIEQITLVKRSNSAPASR